MGLGGDISNTFHTLTNDAGQVISEVSSVVNQLVSLGIECPEYVIQLFFKEGSDAIQEITTIYREITSAGYDCVAFFDMLVIGCQQYGSPQAYLKHLAKRQYAQMVPDLEDMVNNWGTSARPPVNMIADIDTLLAQYPGFGTSAGTQGVMTSTFMTRYADIKNNVYTMAVPMSSTPTSPWQGKEYGRDLQNIWNSFTNNSSVRIESEFQGGTLGWRLAGVVVCIAAIIFADVVLGAVAVVLAGPSIGISLPVGAGTIAVWDLVWVCIAMKCLDILDLFIKMLLEVIGMLVDMLIVAPLAYVWQEIQLSFAASGSSGVLVLTPGQRGQAVQDAWNEIQKELGNLGKDMNDLIKIIGSAELLKKIIELLVCMGYDMVEIANLLTSLISNSALNQLYSLPSVAKGVTVGGSSTLLDVFNQLLDANITGDSASYKGASRVIKAVFDIGPQNIAGLEVRYFNPSGSNSDADIIDRNGDIYELGGDGKIQNFGKQDMAAKEFIENGGTGNPNADIHLWMDASNGDVKQAQAWYETGVKPYEGDPKDYGIYLKDVSYG